MNIRSAKRSDFPAIAAIHAASWQDTYSDVLPESYLAHQVTIDLQRHWNEVDIQPEDIVLVAEDDEISGFIAVWCRPKAFIDNLHVSPCKRSQGMGSKLMMCAAEQLIQRGHKTASLWVVESNASAIRFYERLGGTCKERVTKNLFGHDVPNIKVAWSDISVICTNA